MRRNKGFTLIELLIVIAIIGIIAAIAIPSLLRARVSANEGAMKGDIRTWISAEAAYEGASMGNGWAPLASCLSTPSDGACIPGYLTSAPTFLDANLAQPVYTKGGYVRSYFAGGVVIGKGTDSFCYQGSPVTPARSGVTTYGGDVTGVISGTLAAVNCCTGGPPAQLVPANCVPLN